jgi:hypothetical protein
MLESINHLGEDKGKKSDTGALISPGQNRNIQSPMPAQSHHKTIKQNIQTINLRDHPLTTYHRSPLLH